MKNGEWDIRVPVILREWRDSVHSQPYYWKVEIVQAQAICNALAEAYGIVPPTVICFQDDEIGRRIVARGELRGCYTPVRRVIYVWRRAHVKSVVHEFYHHLDHMTRGEYDSNDHPDGSQGHTTSVSLAWRFADLWWAKLTGKADHDG